MGLEIRPNCEYCDRDLAPSAQDARICSYECTFCAECADTILGNVCPNCGGGFAPRPIRPTTEWRKGLCLAKQRPSGERGTLKHSKEDIASFSAKIKDIKPEDR